MQTLKVIAKRDGSLLKAVTARDFQAPSVAGGKDA